MRIKLLSLVTIPILVMACNKSSFKGRADVINPTVSKEFTQSEYPAATSEHVQGHKGDPQDEKFEQGEWGKLDILVVVDNSGSMTEEQANLATKLEPLLSHVEKSDWQVSVITTDERESCQRALIKKSDPDAKVKFASAVNAGISGSGIEKGILRAVQGLEGRCLQQNWLRADSTLAVLIVTDEDNCSIDANSYGCIGTPEASSDYLSKYLATIRQPGKDAKVYGLLWHPSTPKAQCGTALKTGDIYAKIITETGGKWGSICDADYSQTLKSISEDVAQILKYEFELTQQPDDGTLQILVDGKNWDKFTMEGLKIKFSEPPPFASKVEVSYRHGKEGELANSFSLEKTPVSESVLVEVAGTKVAPGTYHWDDTLKKVVFDTPPGERAAIKFSYKEKVELNNTFDIGPGADPRTLVVLVNNKPAADASYDDKTGLVKINPAPPELASIKISFQEDRSGPKK